MPARIRRTVLVGARLLDGRSPDSTADGVIVIDEIGRIVAAGSARSGPGSATRRARAR